VFINDISLTQEQIQKLVDTGVFLEKKQDGEKIKKYKRKHRANMTDEEREDYRTKRKRQVFD